MDQMINIVRYAVHDIETNDTGKSNEYINGNIGSLSGVRRSL